MIHLFMAHGVDHLCWRGGQQVGTSGSDRGTRPAAEWPRRDNGCYVDKGKTDEFGTLVVDGGGMSPPGI